MRTDHVPCVRLTKKGDCVCYRRDPDNPWFECRLHHENMQKLITDPGSIMKTKRPSFWLKTLVHGIFTGGQFVFETFPPKDTTATNPEIQVAARTLFQLDGDMLVKIDENILARTDGIEIIEAHRDWTNWCIEQFRRAFSSAVTWLRYAHLLLFAIGLSLSLFGGGMYFKTRLPLSAIPIVVGIVGIIWSLILWKLTWKVLVWCALFRLMIQKKIKQIL